jgi:integrase
VHKLIDGMNSSEWRLLVALARWAGLRTPSEPQALKWGHIDREQGRITIPGVKTAERVIPLFPELEQFVQERYDEAEPGDEFVLPMMQRLGRAAYGSKMTYAFQRLGLDRWPRVFHNLRSSRQTELEQLFPSYVVAYWLGNSVDIARKHYLQVLDCHYEQAAQKAAQTVSANARQATPTQTGESTERLDSRNVAKADVGGLRAV